jgi:hypothetical protein
MIRLQRKIATDVYAIKQMGVKSWEKDFFWPISEEEYLRLGRFLYGAFDELYERLDSAARDVILSDIPFLLFLTMHVHAMAVKMYCQKEGVELIIGPLSKVYYSPDLEDLALDHRMSIRKSNWSLQLKRDIKNIKFNSHLSLTKRLRGLARADAIGLGSFSRLKSEYVRREGLYVENTYVPIFLRGIQFSGRSLPSSLLSQMRYFLEKVDFFCRKEYGARLKTELLEECWAKRLSDLYSVYLYVLGRDSLPEELLVTEAARPINRIVAHAYHEKGFRAVGFHHGNGMGDLRETFTSYIDTSSYEEFVCPTTRCAASFEYIYKQSAISRHKPVRFLSIETNYYKDLWTQFQKLPFPKKIRRVMLMGFPMNADRYLGVPGYFFAPQVALELRLVRILKNHGFEVLYKIHPDRKQEAFDIFEPICNRVISQSFEQTWQEADAFVFKYIGSTTFGFALCTNRPIFLLDLEKEYWLPEHYTLLRKRCHMIPAWIDSQNRIRFTEDLLIDKLSQKPEYPDFSYVRQFMFPHNHDFP